MTHERFCFALDLVDDAELIAAYEAWHAPGKVWPAVLDDLQAQGVVDMEIWRTGERVLMIVTASDDFPRPRAAEPAVAEWELLMSRFQRPLPQAGPGRKWAPMTRIFALTERARDPAGDAGRRTCAEDHSEAPISYGD